MNEEKLPKELLVISGKMLPNIYSDCLDHVELQRNADQLLYDAVLAEVAKLEELLQLAHDNMDYLNGVLGTEERLCVFCGSKEADGGGIVHSKDCLIIKMRQSL